MNRPAIADPESLRQFLQTQHFRHRSTRIVYGCVLRNFQRFVFERAARAPPSTLILRQWLKERIAEWPLHMVCHRAGVVDRYLRWMEARGAVPNNPFADLRLQYGRRTTPIVRALLSDDPEAALERLRPPPRFGSFLGKVMEEHVGRMRSVGYRYDVSERVLLRFDRFLQARPELAAAPLPELIDAWSQSNPRPQHLCEAQEAGRLVSQAMSRIDPNVEILRVSPQVRRRARQQQRRPYVYTEEEIRLLLLAAQTFPSPKAALRPSSLYMMVVLAYCAGLRLGEIAALTVGDVHLEDDTIEIRDTKFFKSRRLPLTRSVMTALKDYLAVRQESGAPVSPGSGLFWHNERGRRYSYGGISNLLVQVLRRAGLKPARHRIGPRIHDLRHAMVYHRMLTWYRNGVNPQSHLPYLATYLGHKDINSTLVYLSVTQELLQEANQRFRQHAAEALQAEGERS
jgi:integrase/recombinase XerD